MSDPQTSENGTESKVRVTCDLGNLAHWFIPVVAGVYAAGFLIVFNFANTFGMRGLGLFEAKYIHVGTLFVIGCAIVWVFGMWVLQTRFRKSAVKWRSSIPGILAFGPMMVVFYIVVAFTDRSFFQNHSALVLSNFFVPVVYITIAGITAIFVERARPFMEGLFQYLTAMAALGFAGATLYQDNLWRDVVSIFSFYPFKGGAGFLVLNAIILAYATMTTKRLRDFERDRRSQIRIIFSAVCIQGVLLYLAVLSFAYSVFPFIPAARGGGDYRNAGRVAITFASDRDNPFSATVPDSASNESPLILLDENSDLLFVAISTEADGPSEWQKPAGKKPRVFEIRREAIATLTHLVSNP